MGWVVVAREDGAEREALDLWDLVDRLDRPEAFDRVSLPALLRPLLLLRACFVCVLGGWVFRVGSVLGRCFGWAFWVWAFWVGVLGVSVLDELGLCYPGTLGWVLGVECYYCCSTKQKECLV